MADPKEAHALLTRYIYLSKTVDGSAPVVNRFREKWAMGDVIDSVGYERASELLEHYFTMSVTGHPLRYFYLNFDMMDRTIRAREEDRIRRAKIMKQTKEMVEHGR